MISGPQAKFCEGIIAGLTATEAYKAAYPRSSAKAAESSASALLRNPKITEEIQRLRDLATEKAGSAVLTLMEKRMFVARLVRAKVGELEHDSDLWNSIKRTDTGIEYRLPDKLKAIELDNDLAGEGSEAEGKDALAGLLERIMK